MRPPTTWKNSHWTHLGPLGKPGCFSPDSDSFLGFLLPITQKLVYMNKTKILFFLLSGVESLVLIFKKGSYGNFMGLMEKKSPH